MKAGIKKPMATQKKEFDWSLGVEKKLLCLQLSKINIIRTQNKTLNYNPNKTSTTKHYVPNQPYTNADEQGCAV